MGKWGNISNCWLISILQWKNGEIFSTLLKMRKYYQLLLENNEKLVNLYSSEKMGTCIQVLLQTNKFVVNLSEKIFSFIYPTFNSKFSSNQFRSMNFYSSQKSFLTYIQLLNPKSFQINLNVSVSWNVNYQPKR